jgi:hypothetical protein
LPGRVLLDTTVLVDGTLKGGPTRRRIRQLVRSLENPAAPHYAIRELAAGPLKYAIWCHTVLVQTGSLVMTLRSIRKVSRRQPNRGGLSGEMLEEALQSAGEDQPHLARECAVHLRAAITGGWKRRRQLAPVVHELLCFQEKDPVFKAPFLTLETPLCERNTHGCSAAEQVAQKLDQAAFLLSATVSGPERWQRHCPPLQILCSNGGHKEFDENHCRSLGDAYFAVRLEDGDRILTSNGKDHRHLCDLLRKTGRVVEH